MGMKTNRRRGDWGPSWAPWWIGWALLLFWPLLFGLVAVEVAWLVLVALVAVLAITGKRKAARR